MHAVAHEAVVVGAGVVGLAIARALALRGIEVFVIEIAGGIGYGTSSRNSEVIHAGLYYKPGSLKARLCVDGRRALYQYCNEKRLPHKRCGKLVVAANASEEAYLDQLAQKAEANGVEEFELVNTAGLKALEPSLQVRTERAGIALYRDHRQPRPYAFLSGRYRSSGRDDRFQHPRIGSCYRH